MPKYEIEVKKFSELKDTIVIPKFQRGLVWSKTKKKEFIKTLKAGLPIGVLLLSKKGEKYRIVDGLQRFTTMMEYSRDYFSYIEKAEITDFDLTSIIYASPDARATFDNYTEVAKQKVKENMRDIIVDHISNGQGKNLFEVSRDTAMELCKKISVLPGKDISDILGAVYRIVDNIYRQAKIDDITIPLIVFKGSEDELTDIFQKLNQEGVKLTKYDVFAAAWVDQLVKVKDDPDFIDFIIKKYEVAQKESDLDIESYDPDEMKQKGELTVFEYAFAVGKALMDKCKKLFPKSDEAKVDSVGFLILAELMGLTYQNMGKLAETVSTYTTLDFKKLKDAILESGVFVENALSPYIESPSKNKSGKRISLVCHSELQLASYIIVVFKLKYDLTPENGLHGKTRSKELGRVKEFLYKHYLYDILRGFWAGSGNSKLEEIIMNPTTCRYTKDVAREEFEMVISSWLNDGNKKAESKNISADTKLFLNYLLRTSIHNVDKVSYDIEHCVPKDILMKYFIKKGRIVPISAPCNLVYIPSSDNRGKGELTYYQRQAKDPGIFKLDCSQLDQLGYPSKTELAFIDATSTMTEKNYFEYLDGRKKTILHKFITALYD